MERTDVALTSKDALELQEFNITDAAIEGMKQTMMTLTIVGVSDKVGFAKVHESRMMVKEKRIGVEKVRKKLKEKSLRYGRLVDEEAKRLTDLLQPIEDHLEAQEKKVEEEKARIRKEEEDRKAKLVNDRVNTLIQYSKEPVNMFAIASMSEEEFASELSRLKAIHNEEIEKKKAGEAKKKKIDERIRAFAKYEVNVSPEMAESMVDDTYSRELESAKSYYEDKRRRELETQERERLARESEEKRQQEERERLSREAEEIRKREAAIKEREDAIKRQEVEAEEKRKKEAWELASRRADILSTYTETVYIDVKGLVGMSESGFDAMLTTAKHDWEIAQENKRILADEEARRKEEEKARIQKEKEELAEKMRPDREKLQNFASEIEKIAVPVVQTKEAAAILRNAANSIMIACRILRDNNSIA